MSKPAGPIRIIKRVWECNNCGQLNLVDATICTGCGLRKIERP